MKKKILYCRCAYAQVVPEGTKNAVLEGLCQSGAAFDSVADLCEMSAQGDPKLAKLLPKSSETGANGDSPEEVETVQIAACYPRAVRWLFHSAGVDFPEDEKTVEVLNMREDSAEAIVDRLLSTEEDPSPST